MEMTGKIIRVIRVNRGMTLNDLARLAGLNAGYIGRLETETWPMTKAALMKFEVAFALMGVTTREYEAARDLVEAGRENA